MMLSLDLPDEHIAAALRFGFESGVRYWVRSTKVFAGDTLFDPQTIHPDMVPFYQPIYDGKWVVLDIVSGNRYALKQAQLRRGLGVVFKDHHKTLAELIACAVTAHTGDVLIQCSLFGKLLYQRSQGGNALIICPFCRTVPCRCQAARDITKRETLRP